MWSIWAGFIRTHAIAAAQKAFLKERRHLLMPFAAANMPSSETLSDSHLMAVKFDTILQPLEIANYCVRLLDHRETPVRCPSLGH